MQLDKGRVLDLLRRMGKDAEAERAERELPDEFDSDELEKYGVTEQDLQHAEDEPEAGGADDGETLPPGVGMRLIDRA